MTFRCMLLLLTLGSAAFAEDPLVKPETTTAIEICPTCKDVRVLLIPLPKTTSDDKKIKIEEQPEVEMAFLGAAPKSAKAFNAKWVGETSPRAIDIGLDPEETKQAGTYDLYLNLQPQSNVSTPRLKIQLIRPPATIEAIPKLIIYRTYRFFWWKCDTHPDLHVTETSKKNGITPSVRPVSNASIGTMPIGGTLDFTPDRLVPIPPGAHVTLNYHLKDDFHLGAATGTMKIDAPELASPVSFDFEVRSRVHWIYILVTIVVGLTLSYLLKVGLQQRIEFGQAHLDAQKLVERVAQEETRHADPTFRVDYQNQLHDLTQAMAGADPGLINTTKLALDAAWHTALQTLAKKHQDEADALAKLQAVTAIGWLVPPAVMQAVVKARAAEDSILVLIERDDLTAAVAARRQVTLDLAEEIRAGALLWQGRERQVLNALQAGPSGISATNAAAMTQPVKDLLATLNRVDAGTQMSSPEQIQQALSDIKFERISVQQFYQWLSSAIRMEEAQAEAQIPNPPPTNWNVKNFVAAPDAVTGFTTFLLTLIDNPDPSALPQRLAAVHQGWINALQGQFAAQNASVEAQLDARDYINATKVALRQKNPPPVGVDAALAGLGHPAFVAPEFQRDIAGAAGFPVFSVRTILQTVATPATAVPTSVTDATRLRKEKGIQSLIVGVLLVVAGYGLQLSTFVGTFSDFSTLFFWAFALDLTVDQIGKVAKKG